jgi:predicted  nucleic acid-binding Zn-ribbon protein
MSKDLTLMMNRMGLAYNKHLQTFKELQAVTDPTQVGKIRKAYYDLLAEFDKLTKIHCEKEKEQTEKDETIRNQQEHIRRLTSQCENIELKFENLEVLYKQLLKEKTKARQNARDFNMFPDSFTESDKVTELERQIAQRRLENYQLQAEIDELKAALEKERKEVKKVLPAKEASNVYTLTSSKH